MYLPSFPIWQLPFPLSLSISLSNCGAPSKPRLRVILPHFPQKTSFSLDFSYFNGKGAEFLLLCSSLALSNDVKSTEAREENGGGMGSSLERERRDDEKGEDSLIFSLPGTNSPRTSGSRQERKNKLLI